MAERKLDLEAVQRLLAPGTEQSLDVHRLLAILPIWPYQMVADIGCGPGYLTVPLAKYLRSGRVFAMDVQEEMVLACQRRVEEARLSNVEVARCEETSFPIPGESVDGALLAFVLHHTQDRQAFMRAVAGLLKRGGWCAVVEWQPGVEGGPPPDRRLAQQQVAELAEGAGLRPRGQRNLGDAHHLTLMVK